MALYARFYEEARYKDFLEFDPARARETIHYGITTDTRPHILGCVGETIVGFVSYIFDHSFSTKSCQVLMEIYVAPEYRRSAFGRALVALAVEEGRAAGAGAFHAPIASGMEAARSLRNLFLKAGFEDMGVILRRGL